MDILQQYLNFYYIELLTHQHLGLDENSKCKLLIHHSHRGETTFLFAHLYGRRSSDFELVIILGLNILVYIVYNV